MKTPRLTDFDPDAKAPPLKSSMDNMPAIQKPQPTQTIQSTPAPSIKQEKKPELEITEQSVRPYGSTPVRKDERTPTNTPTPQTRRKLIRYPFEFYEDQVEDFRLLSLQAKLRGEKTSMSEMARTAFDNYLKDKKNRTPVR